MRLLVVTLAMLCTISNALDCPSGMYFDAAAGCKQCAAGFFKADTSAQPCTAYAKCGAGEYTKKHGSFTAQPKCEVCATGFFKAHASWCNMCLYRGCGSKECCPHKKCPPAEYTKTAGSATAQPKCEKCPTGKFKAVTSSSSVKTDSCIPYDLVCPAGEFYNPTGCKACEAGFFKAITSKLSTTKIDSCTPHKKCRAGTQTKKAGTATTQTECEPCPAGTISFCLSDKGGALPRAWSCLCLTTV